MSTMKKWGTWEELVLGGAVVRHGTDSWDAVSGELNSRNIFFNPQECEAKYEDIQEQYSRCNAWFEELRKRRVAELKRELEKSEESIGSLQSKLESLASDRETGSNYGCNASNTESISPIEDTNGIDSSVKELSRDESSAGSFTEKSGTNCTNISEENNIRLDDSSKEKFGCGCLGISFGSFKKKRGMRKRKGCNIVKDNSVGNSDVLSSAAIVDEEKSSVEDDAHMDLPGIMDLITKHEDVSNFKCRLESQKRAGYKKMIRRHVDFRNIRMRISNGSILSPKELFRDLLLLCNNAIVFYPKNSPEHKSALVLRDLVNKTLRRRLSTYPEDGVSVRDNGSPLMEKAAGHENKRTPIACETQARMSVKTPCKKGGQRGIRRWKESSNRGRKRTRR